MPKQKQTEPDKVTTETTAPTDAQVPAGPVDRPPKKPRAKTTRKAVKLDPDLHYAVMQYSLDHRRSPTAEQHMDAITRDWFEKNAPEYLEPRRGRPRKTARRS